MRALSSQGDLVDSYDPVLKAFDGHCYMSSCKAGAGAAGGARAVPRRGEADPPSDQGVEALRRRVAGAVLVRGPAQGTAPAHGRRAPPQLSCSKQSLERRRGRSGQHDLDAEGEVDVVTAGAGQCALPARPTTRGSPRLVPEGLAGSDAGHGRLPLGHIVSGSHVCTWTQGRGAHQAQ